MTINFHNQDEAVKEWTNVLGLSMNPMSMTTVMFKNATWTRRSWTDSCGFTVLDAWDEQGGPHNTDAPMNATYLIPFLGLDQIGPTDPHVARCGGSMTGSGGSSGAGGGGSAGGGSPATGGTGGTNAGSNGGSTASGSGGSVANGGSLGSAGATSPGAGGSNGVIGSGGVSAIGGVSAVGNGGAIQATGGTDPGGEPTAPGGTAGVLSNGAAASDSNGCNCALGGNDSRDTYTCASGCSWDSQFRHERASAPALQDGARTAAERLVVATARDNKRGPATNLLDENYGVRVHRPGSCCAGRVVLERLTRHE